MFRTLFLIKSDFTHNLAFWPFWPFFQFKNLTFFETALGQIWPWLFFWTWQSETYLISWQLPSCLSWVKWDSGWIQNPGGSIIESWYSWWVSCWVSFSSLCSYSKRNIFEKLSLFHLFEPMLKQVYSWKVPFLMNCTFYG